jgi:purine-binding chemotaxis protein CheW
MWMTIEVLIFEIDQRRFGIRSTEVVEVLRTVRLSPLPESSPTVEGLFNMRGRIVPVVDIRRMIGAPPKENQYTDHLIVFHADQRMVALRADHALELLHLEVGSKDNATTFAGKTHIIEHVGKTAHGIVHVLAPSRLLADGDTRALVDALAETEATEVAS